MLARTGLFVSFVVVATLVLPAPLIGLADDDTGDVEDVAVDPSSSRHNVTGLWQDGSHPVQITQTDNQVTALYVDQDPNDDQPAYVCHHRVDADGDGVDDTDGTDLDFNATIDGDTISGDQLTVCLYGADNPDGVGIRTTSFSMTVNSSDTSMTGTWLKGADQQPVPMSLSRKDCIALTAADYGLPDYGTSDVYGQQRVYRKDDDGKDAFVRDVADGEDPSLQAGEFVKSHGGTDYRSRTSDDGGPVSLPFTTPVAGTVEFTGGGYGTVGLRLFDGSLLQLLHASRIDVAVGQDVAAGDTLGMTGMTGATAIHLHVQAKDANGKLMNPDCAVTRAKQAADQAAQDQSQPSDQPSDSQPESEGEPSGGLTP